MQDAKQSSNGRQMSGSPNQGEALSVEVKMPTADAISTAGTQKSLPPRMRRKLTDEGTVPKRRRKARRAGSDKHVRAAVETRGSDKNSRMSKSDGNGGKESHVNVEPAGGVPHSRRDKAQGYGEVHPKGCLTLTYLDSDALSVENLDILVRQAQVLVPGVRRLVLERL